MRYEWQSGEFNNTQGLVNVVWAYATAGHEAPLLYAAVASRLQQRADAAAPQGLLLAAFSC